MQPAAFVLCLSSFHIRWYSPHWMVSTPARSSLHKPPASASLRRSPRIRELAQRKTRTTSNIVIAPIQPHTPTRTPAHPKNMAASTTYNRRRRTSTVRIASPPPQLPQVRHRHQGRSNFLPPRTSHFTRMSEIIRGLQKYCNLRHWMTNRVRCWRWTFSHHRRYAIYPFSAVYAVHLTKVSSCYQFREPVKAGVRRRNVEEWRNSIIPSEPKSSLSQASRR